MAAVAVLSVADVKSPQKPTSSSVPESKPVAATPLRNLPAILTTVILTIIGIVAVFFCFYSGVVQSPYLGAKIGCGFVGSCVGISVLNGIADTFRLIFKPGAEKTSDMDIARENVIQIIGAPIIVPHAIIMGLKNYCCCAPKVPTALAAAPATPATATAKT
jgi:hypothetical protein